MGRSDFAKRVGKVLVAVATLFTLVDVGGQWGGWTWVWAHWVFGSTILLAALMMSMTILAVASVSRPNDRGLRAMWVVGAMSVAVALLDRLHLQPEVGSVLLGSVASTVVTVCWLAQWIVRRQREQGEEMPESIRNGLADWGRRWFGRLHGLVLSIADGPRPPDQEGRAGPRRRAMSGPQACFAGIVVIALFWTGATATLTAIAYAPSRANRSNGDDKKPTPQVGDKVAPTPGPITTSSATPIETTTAPPRGNLHCPYPFGEGPNLPSGIRSEVAAARVKVMKVFHPCATGPMAWRSETRTYEQPIFTDDGGGAVLIGWDTGDALAVVFVSSDDAATYRSISAQLDWTMLGRPLAFVRCDGLWVQPMVGANNRIIGAGVRDREDTEGSPDRPFYVWGSTLEALLHREANVLRLPVGMPTVDSDGRVQYFEDGEVVHSPLAPANGLTVDQLLRHCSASG